MRDGGHEEQADTLSVIIPTLNEARNLPRLLEALHRQTRQPDEIIVADANSADGTAAVARQMGAKVVQGGRPAEGRNAGARASRGQLLLFLDADVLPEPDFVSRFLQGFEARALDVATCLTAPLSDRRIHALLSEAANLYLQLVQNVAPHAPGYCILARRWLHEAIGGFDEDLAMAEDHDYVQRGARVGRFGVVTEATIRVSTRRMEKEGLFRLGMKYLYCELHALTGRPMYTVPFAYEFGAYDRPRPRRFDLERLRQQITAENPLLRLSERGREILDLLGSPDLSPQAFHQRLQELLPEEVGALRDYLRQRLTTPRPGQPPFLDARRPEGDEAEDVR